MVPPDAAMQQRNKKRQRKAASCNPCRARKHRCDRGLPCGSCVAKGKPEDCVWDSDALPPLYKADDPSEVASLRSEVQRLQSYINSLTSLSASSSSNPVQLPLPPSIARRRQSTNNSDHTSPLDTSSEDDDEFLTHELASKLADMSIRAHRGAATGSDDRTTAFLTEARERIQQTGPEVAPPNRLKLPSERSKLSSIKALIDRLPSRRWLTAAESFYWSNMAFYVHLIPKWHFEKHKRIVEIALDEETEPESISLALVAGIWSLGLVTMPAKAGLSSADQLAGASTAADLCWAALSAARFMEIPTPDTIRVLLIFAGHYVVLSPTDDVSNPGMSYLQMAMQACIQLDMHRDPIKLGLDLTEREMEDRRRLFWTAFLVFVHNSVAFTRYFSVISIDDVDCEFPADVADEDMGTARQTELGDSFLSSLLVRYKNAKISAEITEKLPQIEHLPYARVLELDRRLVELEESIPGRYRWCTLTQYDQLAHDVRACQTYLIHISIAYSRLRLHRPFLTRSYHESNFSYSQKQAIDASIRIVEGQVSKIMARPISTMNYRSLQAAIVLLLHVHIEPASTLAPRCLQLITELERVYEDLAKQSSMCLRAAKIVGFLREKLLRPRSAKASSQSASPHLTKSINTSPSSFEPETPLSNGLPPSMLSMPPPFANGVGAGQTMSMSQTAAVNAFLLAQQHVNAANGLSFATTQDGAKGPSLEWDFAPQSNPAAATADMQHLQQRLAPSMLLADTYGLGQGFSMAPQVVQQAQQQSAIPFAYQALTVGSTPSISFSDPTFAQFPSAEAIGLASNWPVPPIAAPQVPPSSDSAYWSL
ncbi:hypothetical protein ACM66B_000528 [Microbotryomycetes sp. NB124-2]